MICWKCREPTGGPVCVGCGAVQPLPPEDDLFAVLGLPRRAHLTEEQIEHAVRERSRVVHPDRHVSAGAVERRMALQWTAKVNEARRTLRDPVKRAYYLVFGQADTERAPQPSDLAFLERVFAWRMEAETDPVAVRREVALARDDLEQRLEAVFVAWESGRGDLEPARDLLSRLRFVVNTARELGL